MSAEGWAIEPRHDAAGYIVLDAADGWATVPTHHAGIRLLDTIRRASIMQERTTIPAPAADETDPDYITGTMPVAGGYTVVALRLSDLQTLLHVAQADVDKHRTYRDALDTGSHEAATSHAIVQAWERVRDVVTAAELAR